MGILFLLLGVVVRATFHTENSNFGLVIRFSNGRNWKLDIHLYIPEFYICGGILGRDKDSEGYDASKTERYSSKESKDIL